MRVKQVNCLCAFALLKIAPNRALHRKSGNDRERGSLLKAPSIPGLHKNWDLTEAIERE
jgi:hypothetical protein